MATAGMEVRWPVLFSTASAAHILEPIGQIFVRPDEPYGNTLGIPNEDAQSLVFDASNLFERDKFSGFDRIEGGTRANLGFRYSGDLGGGWTTNAIFGQSYHLAGRNPYASIRISSMSAPIQGLQTAARTMSGRSDSARPVGFNFTPAHASTRRLSAPPRRCDDNLRGSLPVAEPAATPTSQTQPTYGFAERPAGSHGDRLAAGGGALARLRLGHLRFRVSRTLVSRSIGFTYDDECFLFTLPTPNAIRRAGSTVSRSIGFRVSMRTLGDFGSARMPGFD
jgi:LPS-assembly protein